MSTQEQHNFNAEFFTKMAKQYEAATGGATRRLVREILTKASPPIDSSSFVLDHACGPAIVTSEILSKGGTPKIIAADSAEGMINITNAYKQINNWETVEAKVMDCQSLKEFSDNMFTHTISSLGVFMFPDFHASMKEIHRTLQPGGWVGVTSWKNVDWWLTPAKEAYRKMRPEANADEKFKSILKPEWETEVGVKGILADAGFKNVDAVYYETRNVQESMEEMAKTFCGMIRHVMPATHEFSDEELEKYKGYLQEELAKNAVEEDGKMVIKVVGVLGWGSK